MQSLQQFVVDHVNLLFPLLARHLMSSQAAWLLGDFDYTISPITSSMAMYILLIYTLKIASIHLKMLVWLLGFWFWLQHASDGILSVEEWLGHLLR